jgi:hypothetical protein
MPKKKSKAQQVVDAKVKAIKKAVTKRVTKKKK